MTKSYASPAMDQSNSGCPPEVDFDLWHEWYDPLLRLCCEFEGSTCHFDTELYSNTSWLRVCRYVEPGVDCVLASVGRSPASHAGVGVGVGVGAGVGVGEKPETTRPQPGCRRRFFSGLQQTCCCSRNHEWEGVGGPRDSSRGARGAQFCGARSAQLSRVLDGRPGRPCVSTATADTCAWRPNTGCEGEQGAAAERGGGIGQDRRALGEANNYFWRGRVAPLTPAQAALRDQGFRVGPLSAYPAGGTQQPITPPKAVSHAASSAQAAASTMAMEDSEDEA